MHCTLWQPLKDRMCMFSSEVQWFEGRLSRSWNRFRPMIYFKKSHYQNNLIDFLCFSFVQRYSPVTREVGRTWHKRRLRGQHVRRHYSDHGQVTPIGIELNWTVMAVFCSSGDVFLLTSGWCHTLTHTHTRSRPYAQNGTRVLCFQSLTEKIFHKSWGLTSTSCD